MKFSDLICCPFCGNDEFYTKSVVTGSSYFNERFDGEETNNESMYEGLNFNSNGKAYCRRCNKYLGNTEKNEVGKMVLSKRAKDKERIARKERKKQYKKVGR